MPRELNPDAAINRMIANAERSKEDAQFLGGWPPHKSKAENEIRAEECACSQRLLDCVADILHNQTTDRSPLQAYGLTDDRDMRAAAKVLRHLATAMRVREIKIRSGEI